GEVTLAPSVGNEFGGTSLAPGWSATPWSGSGTAVVGGGVLTLDGARTGTGATYSPGVSLESMATFSGAGDQEVGFGLDFQTAPWIAFGLVNGALQAVTSDGTNSVATPIPGIWTNAPHRFWIDWEPTIVTY